MKPVHIVFTTINHPEVLNNLIENIGKYNHLEEVKVWIVGDHKTPVSCGELAKKITEQGLESTYLSIEEQDKWGQSCESFYSRIPYNNETRRNIGYLKALEDGCEILISIDDDNFPTSDDLVGIHSKTGSTVQQGLIEEPSGYHNVCEYLEMNPSRSIFPRGYPFKLRGVANAPTYVKSEKPLKVGVTAGLWLDDPDIDATTWLNGKVSGVEYTGGVTQILAQNTWTPINTQNTSVIRDLIPAYLCVPMGWPVPGGQIQRYGDIWGGYFMQAITRGTEYVMSFGRPIVQHKRNPHDYIDDLRFEFWGMILTDWLLEKLRSDFYPSSSQIVDRVTELADFLKKDAIQALPEWCPKEVNDFLIWTEGNLRTWADACRVFL